MTDRAHRGWTALALALSLVTAVAVLWPDGWVVNRAVVQVYVFFLERGMPQSVTPETYATLLNVLAFVPLGWLGVSLLRRRVPTVALALLVLSVAVEVVQSLPGLSRVPSAVDVLLNAAGGLLGAVLGAVTSHHRTRSGRGDRDSSPG